MSVLILAPERNITADRMVQELNRRIETVRVDTAWFPTRARLDASFVRGRWVGCLDVGSRSVVLEGVRSIWYRNPSAFRFAAGMSQTEEHWAMGEAKLGFGGVLAALPVRWVNHPARNADAAYKPVQLRVAASCGLRVPETLITNDAAAVRRFAAEGPAVSKALGAPAVVEAGGRAVAFTRLLTDTDLPDLAGVHVTAHQFQRWVPKDHEVRVIAVGEQLFAARIDAHSEAARIDWRADYPALTYTPVEPPEPVAAGIRAYLHALGLLYGAFDFVVEPDGAWTFLECNPGGQYGWIEDAIDAPITLALADLLAGEPA